MDATTIKEAEEIHTRFTALRDKFAAYARTNKGEAAIAKVDANAGRKLRHHPGDISPARLLTLSRKLAATSS